MATEDPKPTTKVTTFQIPIGIHRRMKLAVMMLEKTQNEIVAEALREYLDQYVDVDVFNRMKKEMKEKLAKLSA